MNGLSAQAVPSHHPCPIGKEPSPPIMGFTQFRALIESPGFSRRDAAAVLDTAPSKITDIRAGRRPIRIGQVDD